MTDHLTPQLLSALADGELSPQQLAGTNEHLAGCPACTRSALEQTLLKSATARAGHRYALPPHLQDAMLRLAHQQKESLEGNADAAHNALSMRSVTSAGISGWSGRIGWNAAAILLLAFAATLLLQHYIRRTDLASAQETALVTEVFDQHVATLAAGTPPQVLSTDRHTVKPWFQGKIPFSFNLPENLPADTMLDGANLNYLDGQPVAQLLYSIGRHRVSVFVRQQDSLPPVNAFSTDHAGFHVMVFTAGDLAITAISDADSARLNQLASAIRQSQTANQQQRR